MLFVLPLGPESDDLEDAAVSSPFVTWGLVAICTLVYLGMIALASQQQFIERIFFFAFLPDQPLGRGVLAHLFIHQNFMHLLSNIIFLAAFGITVERRLGHFAVFSVFLVSGVLGAWSYAATASQITADTAHGPVTYFAPLVGVSAPLMGFVGCLLPTMPTLRMRLLVGFFKSYRVVAVEAWKIAVCYLLKEVFVSALAVYYGGTVPYGALAGGVLAGLFVGGAIVALQRATQVDEEGAGGGTVGMLVHAGRETGVVAGPSRTIPPKPKPRSPTDSVSGVAPAAAAPVPDENMDLEVSIAPPKKLPADEDIEDLPPGPSDAIEMPDEDELPSTEPSPEELAELQTGLVDVSVVAEAEMPMDIGNVPVDQDYSEVSSIWAGSAWLADLQERLNRARRLEKKPGKFKTAFRFYKTILHDRNLPSGYRAYAGARAARMLLRRHNFQKSFKLATRLLKNEVPPEIRAHLYQTASFAWRALKKQASGELPTNA